MGILTDFFTKESDNNKPFQHLKTNQENSDRDLESHIAEDADTTVTAEKIDAISEMLLAEENIVGMEPGKVKLILTTVSGTGQRGIIALTQRHIKIKQLKPGLLFGSSVSKNSIGYSEIDQVSTNEDILGARNIQLSHRNGKTTLGIHAEVDDSRLYAAKRLIKNKARKRRDSF